MTRGRPSPPAIYPIADDDALGGEVEEAVSELAAAGASWIQVRAKGAGDRRLYDLVAAACRVSHGARIWVNDRPDLAALLPVAGVHLGQRDLPVGAARAVVGPGVWIGVSTHDERQVGRAARDPEVDVIAVGPVFATGSKTEAEPVVGLELVARARALTDKPLIAIGGIDRDNVSRVLAAGADGAAVIGAVSRRPVGERLRQLARAAGDGG